MLKIANKNLCQLQQTETKCLRDRMNKLEKQIHLCEQTHISNDELIPHLRKLFKNVFSENQLDVILGRKQKPKWTTEEISTAFTIRYLSKRCYMFIRNNLHIPLPGLSTLSSYAQRINLREGILKQVLYSMYLVGLDKTTRDLACILTFDEMSVHSMMEFDSAQDEIVGPHSHVQVIMARGLFAKWKQVVYVAFDTPVTKNLLYDVVIELHKIKYQVVGINSDNGPENVCLRKQLGISIEKNFF